MTGVTKTLHKWNTQIHYIPEKEGLVLFDGRKENTKMIHVQLRGANSWDGEIHDRIVNLPSSQWNLPNV